MSDTLAPANPICRREFTSRAEAAANNIVRGIGVPYDVIITPDPEGLHLGECFDQGSVVMHDDGTKLFWRHWEPIGRVDSITQTPEGAAIVGPVSDTTTGRDALTLVGDGVVTQLSVGWAWAEATYYVDSAGVRHWTHVPAREFSLAPFGAYGPAASVSRTAKETTAMTTAAPESTAPPTPAAPATPDVLTRADLAPINAALDELTRTAALGVHRGGHAPQMKYRSMGEFLKAIVAGDEEAMELHRAYTGATTADTVMKDSFVGEYIKLVTERRRIVNKFGRETLPGDGLSVDYYQLDTDTTKVEKQANQGDNLAYGKVKLKSANSQISTYGGYTELTRQAIERATLAALNVTLRALGLKYGMTTEAAARAVYKGLITANLADGKPHVDLGATFAAATASDWINALIDGAEYYETNGFVIGGLDVSKDVFKLLASLKDGDTRLMKVYGDGVNQVGELNISNLTGNLAGVKVEMLPLADAGTASFYDPVAMTTLESPGAPAQLQDENIINLSKQFSVYGYSAIITPFTTAIYPIKPAAA